MSTSEREDDSLLKVHKKGQVEAALHRADVLARLRAAELASELIVATRDGGNRRIGFRVNRTTVFCEGCNSTVTQSVWKHFGHTLAPKRTVCPWLKLGLEYVSQLRLPTQKEITPVTSLNTGQPSLVSGRSDGQPQRPLVDDTMASTHQLGHKRACQTGDTSQSSRAAATSSWSAQEPVMDADAANSALLRQQVTAHPIATGAARAVLNYDLTTPQGRAYALLRRTEENLEQLARYQKQLRFHMASLNTLQGEAQHFLVESTVCLQELRAQVAEFMPANG
eukprot:m.9448 g.9448  ORF g.9448 m.9448 type:complete len:280 (-) comp9424_c0_seq1:3-842(-)